MLLPRCAQTLPGAGCNRAGQTGTSSITVPRDTTGGPKEAAERMKQMQQKLSQKMVEAKLPQRIAKQVRMIDTTEGIRIDLVDDADFAMFQLGTTVLTSDAAALLKAIGAVIAPQPGAVSIRGHTDALPWRGGARINNWSLSAGRAEATRQALLRQGVAETRYRKIEGVADREPLVKNHPEDPRNRRISILLLR